MPTATDRTTEPTALRVTLSTGAATGTVPSGPSASENAEGARRWQRPGPFSRHARVTEKFRHDSEVTAVSYQRTRTPSSRDSGTPRSQDPEAISRAEIEQEACDLAAFEAGVRDLAALAAPFWRWGDGNGGYVRHQIEQALARQGLIERRRAEPKPYMKAPIPAALRRQVFERDAYRCQQCGSWRDLHADHIHPESKGGPTTLDNLQTLCGPCNIRKGARV